MLSLTSLSRPPRSARALVITAPMMFALLVSTACRDNKNPVAEENSPVTADVTQSHGRARALGRNPVGIEVFAPETGDRAGIGSLGFVVDMEVTFKHANLAQTGFTGLQLTGPGSHANILPFPGLAAPGHDERFPGLMVLLSTTQIGAGSCQNLAGLFNITGVTNRNDPETELWATWLVGAAGFGHNVDSKLSVAVARDINGDGIYNDAPDVIPDSNRDGVCDERDLRAFGLDSDVETADFSIID
jgi:hypothetical protein